MSTSSTSSTPQSGSGKKHTAGAYDVRFVIGALIGFFGIVLVVMGLVNNSGADLAKAGGVNANLWTGIAMVVVAVVFAVWTWLRPVVVDPSTIDDADDLSRANH
jgi:uncharacterized membrane protein